ncbi:hypothetical protein BT69DRAFT_757883 [Atractiella rhizophila]|nr:hypothetical protein BT69DRAFT_757883 [Atractiella rhizophila]
MTKTQSFFGPDVFLQKELEKLKLIEAQEQKEKKEEERKQQEKDSKKLRRKSKAMEKEVEGNGQKEDDDDDVPLGHFVPPTLSLPTVESLPQNMNSWFDADRDDQTSAHSHEKEDLRMQSDPRSPTPPIMPLSLSRPTHMATKSKAISVNSYQAFPSSNHGHASPALQMQQNRQYDRDESDSDDVPLAQVADKKRMTKATTSSQFLNIPALDDLSKDDDSLDDEVPLSMLPKKSTPKKPNSTRSVMQGQDSDDDEQPLAYRATQLALEGQRHPLTGGEDDDDVPLALKMAHGRSEDDDDVPLVMRQSNLNMVNAQAQAQALMMAQMQQNQHLSMMGMAMPQPMPMAPNFMRMADDEDGGSMGMPEFNNPALNDTVNRWRNQVSTEEG